MDNNNIQPEELSPEKIEVVIETAISEENTDDNRQQESTMSQPLKKEDLIEALNEILKKDGEDIKREEVSRIKQAYNNLRKAEVEAEKQEFIDNGGDEESFNPTPDSTEQEFLAVVGDIRQKKTLWIEQREKQLLENLEKKDSIIDAIEALANDTDNVNRSYTRFKELTQQFRETGDVPQEKTTSTWKRFQEAEQHFYDQLKINQELRDYDFKKNLEIKQELIEKAESLAALFDKASAAQEKAEEPETETTENKTPDASAEETKAEETEGPQEPQEEKAEATAEPVEEIDIVAAFKQLQDLHDRWKLTGPVAKEIREELWQRFRNATVKINKIYQAFFEERKANEKANEAAKIALCEKVESIDTDAIKTAKEWEKYTREVIEAQNQWKNTGYISRKNNNALYNRFRAKCDEFFKKKGEFFSNLKEQQNENLRLKTQLMKRAEELSGSTDWNAAAAELTKLQSEWKTIGAIPRKQSDALWERFHTACDNFFNRRKEELNKSRSEERENLKLKEAVIEELKALAEEADIQQVKTRMSELQAKWKEIGFVPFKEKNKISDAYRNAVNTLRKKFNLSESKNSFEKFRNSVEEFSGDSGRLNRERDRLFRVLEGKRADLANYLNNMGFLTSKSRNAEGLIKEIEHKIDLIKSDIADLEQKITLIDSKL